jgi:hypothetical protein
MKKNTSIKYKEVVVCEESGHASLNNNVILTTPNVNAIIVNEN